MKDTMDRGMASSHRLQAGAIALILGLAFNLAGCIDLGINTGTSGEDGHIPVQSTGVTPEPLLQGEGAGAAGGVIVIQTLFDQLVEAPKVSGKGYSRDAFGEGWIDTDDNGCYTRADILARDLTEVVKEGRCKVQRGQLKDPYTGETIVFDAAKDRKAIQIDHVVALKNAWTTGAHAWDRDKRVAFANDPLNLLAVDGDANEAKGHKDAAEWLPPNAAAHCAYVGRQIAVKARYGLWVTPDEADALESVLSRCPSTMAVASNTIFNVDGDE